MKLKLLLFLLTFLTIAKAQTASPIVAGKEYSERYFVAPVNINSTAAEYSPFIFKNKLYFVSNRNEKIAVSYTANNQNTSDIFECTRIDSITFSKPKNLGDLNSVRDDGPLMMNSNGNNLVFSSSNAKGKLQIYFSILENGKWGKPLLHPVSRPSNSYCHPFLSQDGNTLFFCSDMEGGFGGMDLYYSKFENLNWSNPVNLGPKINTGANEVFPFVTSNGQLYFSSNRSNGKGNLDIYSFDLTDSTKAKAVLLESPINSTFDDFGICFDENTPNGYFSSNRNANEGDNVFYFSNLFPEFTHCIPMKKSSCYTFMKDNYSFKDESLENEYEWDFGDGNKARAKAVKHCFSKSGFYTVRLNVVEKANGKIVYNEMAYTIAVRPQGLQVDVKDSLYLNTDIDFDATNSQLDGYSILKYNWIFNDTSFSKGPRSSHRYSQNGIYLVELGVEAQHLVSKQISNFCIDKWILVGDVEYVSKNLKYFKFAELLPDADSLYFENEDEEAGLNAIKKKKSFRFSKLTADAYNLTGEEDEDVLLNEQERKLRTHKFGQLTADESALEKMEDNEALLRAKQKLMHLKNASLPPIVDTLYLPKVGNETIYRVNLGLSDSKVDKNSGVFDGIKKLEETREGNRYRYTSGNEKSFSSIIPYYESAKQKGFKDAAVIGFVNDTIGKGQAKNLKAILFDSASVENHAVKIYFKYDVPTYDKKYNKELESFIKNAKSKENQKILLIAHFDGLGTEEYNMNLNTLRTNNLINYLVSKGLIKSQIKTEYIIHPTEKLEPDLLRRIEVFLMN